MDRDREIYPNAPLQFVACEVRFPPLAGPEEAQRMEKDLRAELHDSFPIAERRPQLDIQVAAGAPAITGWNAPQLLDRTRTTAVTLTVASLIIETSRYERYEQFRLSIEQVLQAAVTAVQPAGVERVGLRYIDEIQVPGVEAPGEWEPYIDARLLPPQNLVEWPLTEFRGAADFSTGESQRLVVQYGARRDGFMVDPNGPLEVRPRAAGPFFVIDIDSFWEQRTPLPEYESGFILGICDRLHEPIRAVFEASITERLRDDVLRRESS